MSEDRAVHVGDLSELDAALQAPAWPRELAVPERADRLEQVDARALRRDEGRVEC